jgi:hypothetical protein
LQYQNPDVGTAKECGATTPASVGLCWQQSTRAEDVTMGRYVLSGESRQRGGSKLTKVVVHKPSGESEQYQVLEEVTFIGLNAKQKNFFVM